jgi:hypothetical protein
VSDLAYALAPSELLRSVDASRDTLGRARVRLIDVVHEVTTLTDGAPYAVIGGLAQILWARKTHTDDLDVLLAVDDLTKAAASVRAAAVPGWSTPGPPDRFHEADVVFEVYVCMFKGSVVDLLSFRHEAFNAEILATAQPVPELGDIRFIRPELLLVTQLLRPGPLAALAAVELTLARRTHGGLDVAYAARWAGEVGKSEALQRTFARADDLSQESELKVV